MPSVSNIILYVKDIAESTRFYEALFAAKPVTQAPGFAMFALGNGQVLGLWATAAVEPESGVTGGGAEYCIDVADTAELDKRQNAARSAGIAIAQPITEMPFGKTFVLTDPDRHRIRYILPNPS